MLELTRLPDWDQRLARLVERHMQTPGVWGAADCLLTAMDAVEAVTGVDPAASVRGRYKTQLGAARLLRRNGFDDVEQALASRFPEVGRLLAQRGDLAVIERDSLLCAGFVCSHGVAVKVETGLVFVPQTDIKSAFKVA